MACTTNEKETEIWMHAAAAGIKNRKHDTDQQNRKEEIEDSSSKRFLFAFSQ